MLSAEDQLSVEEGIRQTGIRKARIHDVNERRTILFICGVARELCEKVYVGNIRLVNRKRPEQARLGII